MKAAVWSVGIGLSSIANAQPVATMEMVADGVWDGDNRMTLSIFADGEYMQGNVTATHLLGVEFSLQAIGENSTVESISVLEGPGWDENTSIHDEGYDGEGGHSGFLAGQVVFLPFLGPSDRSALGDEPIFIASFEVILSEAITPSTELGWSFGEYIPFPGPSESWTPVTLFDAFANPATIPGEVIELREDRVEFGSFFIPTPSGLALLGLGGLVAGCRRR
jgi:hypothetical protein